MNARHSWDAIPEGGPEVIPTGLDDGTGKLVDDDGFLASLEGVVGREIAERMKQSSSVTSERCYEHPESPTGYVGKGRWCEHKRAALAALRGDES